MDARTKPAVNLVARIMVEDPETKLLHINAGCVPPLINLSSLIRNTHPPRITIGP